MPSLPIWRDVDVLVVGATTRAVAAALDAHRQGRRALVLSDLSYFGQDTAGTLACAPEFPAAAKHKLELSLLRAGIPFVYLVRPVAILRDEDARVAGALVAARTSLFAVTCRAIVDATPHGVVFRLAGAKPTPRAHLPATLGWNVIAKEAPAGSEEVSPPFPHKEGPFRVFRVPVACGADPLSREHLARAGLVDERVLITADSLQDFPEAEFAPLPDVLPDARDLPARKGKPPVPTQGDFRFAPAFLRDSLGTLQACPTGLPSLGRVDVAVAGGGTAGAPAGIAAAREGARTVVLEMQHGLGGVGTLGLISIYYYGNRVGFTRELDQAVMAVDADSRAKSGVRWSPEVKVALYHRMLRDAGGTAWLGSYAFGVRMDGDRVNGLLVSTPFGAGLLEADSVVDATGSADVAAAAGAPCRVIGADHVATQGTGLSPRVHPGVRRQNSDHTFIDDTDPEGVTHAFVNARAKFPGDFDTSPMVDSRERRQALGELEVSPLDILAERTFPDTVFTAISNFDTHGFIVHPVFMVAAPNHDPLRAHVPYRCMLPKGVEGVLVTGLGMSAHRDALPVIRMQADVQNQGFAAGIAAAMTGKKRLRDLDVRALQRRLVENGTLAADVPSHQDSFPVSPGAVRAAMADLASAKNVAVLFAHPEQARPLLLADSRVEAAIILGLMGAREAAPALAKAVAAAGWDQGWNYRGMGQFGESMSRVDVMILALARTRDPIGVPAIAAKLRLLDAQAAFSHCRVAALAAALLPSLAPEVARLLRLPGMTGHAQVDTRPLLADANGDPCETGARNLALRELHLARGLFLAGDPGGLARRTLETYARDLRGHFARHARAVLGGAPAAELA
jgi:hypothetical protein